MRKVILNQVIFTKSIQSRIKCSNRQSPEKIGIVAIHTYSLPFTNKIFMKKIDFCLDSQPCITRKAKIPRILLQIYYIFSFKAGIRN